MKINFAQVTYSSNINKSNDVSIKNKSRKVKNSLRNVSYPASYYAQTFKGLPLGKMYEEYNWYIRNDGVPAVNAFMKMEYSKEIMNGFLTEILTAKDRGYEFIESIVNQPRNTEQIQKGLEARLGKDSRHLLTFIPNAPYNNAYINFIETKFENAHTLNELLKIRPDWRGDVLVEKYKTLTGKENLKIGCLPKFMQKEHVPQIMDYLRSKMEIGLKTDKKIEDLVLDGRTYQFKFFTEGKSSKNVFGLFIPASNKKYVIKMDDPEKRSLDAPFALGTLAKIDAYLTTNRSRNSAPLCYYNHKYNCSIYKYIEHTPVDENDHDITTIRRKLPDFRALGLEYNDTVGFKNFFKLDKNSSDTHYKMEGFNEAIDKNEWISVDNDHVTFNTRMQPSLNKYHTSLPNAMGMFF